ncbi:LysR family transcriptional regulator [Pseudovibrio sp. SPO723]|uniref:LysR family transcriptional regulator n=1 Tax=Nesiotobacter zosterae TaxID=392721 RepID=UPI0029C3EAA8|nr:LysR family transcriptional regulator [Pseudovibrio sp. SPO723]MDX5595513.1 LysR family transcriptional regulator [Pseudovibrio sp. SPO723]
MLVWDDAKAFLAVARKGQLSSAAQHMGLGIATLSRRLDRLEGALGVKLFQRHQTGYSLTSDGEELLEKAEMLEGAAQAFQEGAQHQAQVRGRVRLATAENFASHLIIPRLSQFASQYPSVTLDIVTEIRTANLHRRDADLALRLVKPTRGNITLRRLGTLGFGLYAGGAFVNQVLERKSAQPLTEMPWISWGEAYSDLPAAEWAERYFEGEPRLLASSLASHVAAARAGLGLAVLPHFLAHGAGLVCVEPDISVSQPIYLVIHSDLTQTPRVRVTADFLAELVEENRDWLSHPVG